MSAPDAPAELRAAHGAVGAAALRFVILLRDPISRATSSVRMMREWGWEAANRSAALARDAAALRVCLLTGDEGADADGGEEDDDLDTIVRSTLSCFDSNYLMCVDI